MGCDVLDVSPLATGETLDLQCEDGERGTGAFWADVAAERDGHVLARYAGGPLSGRPALLQTSYGAGHAYYIGCRLDYGTLARLYSLVPALRPNAVLKHAGTGIERVVRVGTDRRYEFLLNYSGTPREIEVPEGGLELLTGLTLGPRVTLGATGVAIIRYPRASKDR